MTPFTQGPLSGWRDERFPLAHAFFSRHGGGSSSPFASLNTAFRTQDPKAAENREQLLSQLHLASRPGRILNPCHGDTVALLTDKDWQDQHQGVLLQTDAAFTTSPGSWLMVSTADCIPLVLTDLRGSFAGLVHLGWRNVVANLTGRAVDTACRHLALDPATLIALLGPAIYPCCYHFQDPVQQENPFWHPFLDKVENGQTAIDLVSAAKTQLTASGLLDTHIFEIGLCTSCHNEVLFSCYKEGYVSGRFPSLVWMDLLSI